MIEQDQGLVDVLLSSQVYLKETLACVTKLFLPFPHLQFVF